MEEEEAPVAFDTFAPLAVGRFVKGADVLDSGALCFDFEMHEGLDRFLADVPAGGTPEDLN